MRLVPALGRVVILPEERKTQTASGIYIEADGGSAKFISSKGVLISIGGDCKIKDSMIGKELRFKDYAKEEVIVEDNGEKKTYFIVPETDVIAFLIEENEI